MSSSRWTEYFSSAEGTSGEKKLVRKIDFFILSFCCLILAFWDHYRQRVDVGKHLVVNYLDRSNLTAAYVSGMKADLAFRGNQFNQINTLFTIGYTIGQIPSNIALRYVKPRIFFPTMIVAWATLTMCTAASQRPQDIMGIRFVQGMAESSTFVGTHYILGSWYTERELGKRSGVFTASGLAGTMLGGFIQTGIHSHLNGNAGLPGWRWLFIIDGLITLPIALYGYLLFPDTPATTTAPYLSRAEKALAVRRIPPPQHQLPLNVAFLRTILSSWKWWGFVVLWIIAGETESFSSNSLLALFLQAKGGYSVAQLNDYPTGVPAVGIVSTLFWATLTDHYGGKRYLVGYYIGLVGIATSVMILAGGARTPISLAAYYWAGSVYACQATFFAWANDAMRCEDATFRAVVLASMNTFSNAVNAWWSLLFYSANFAPSFTRGMWAMIATCTAMITWTSGLLLMTVKSEKEGESCDGRGVRAKNRAEIHGAGQ